MGTPVRRVRRVHYVYAGHADTDFGPVELTVGERTFVFDAGADGEALRISEGPWVDPFAEPLSEENRRFVEESGKWAAFDMSPTPTWAAFVGKPLCEATALADTTGKVVGIILRIGDGGLVRLGVMADELFVDEVAAPT